MKGILNVGNTCYFNTSLQCLVHVPIIKSLFVERGYNGPCSFTKGFSEFTRKYWDDSLKITFNVNNLLGEFVNKFPRFVIGRQHDAQEAMLCIIDILENSVPEMKKHFYGKKIQETIWPGGKKTHEEIFSIHILTSTSTSLGEMMRNSLKWNVLNDYEDDDGKVHHVATTRCLFSECPSVLMISFDKRGQFEVVENISIDDHDYELVASAIHMGVQRGGHYLAFTKTDNQWYYKDDDTVRPEKLPIMAPHYLLMYTLKTHSS